MRVGAMAERQGSVLVGWLRLLGWTVEIEWDGGSWVGYAKRPAPAGEELRVGGWAGSRRELVSTLYQGAIRDLQFAA